MYIVRYGANKLGNYSFTMPTGFSADVDIYAWGAGGGSGQHGPNTKTGMNLVAGATPQSTTEVSDTTWIVPGGVSAVNIILSGASGGKGGDAVDSNGIVRKGTSGFAGHRIQGTLSVRPGQVLTLRVGSGGTNGWVQNALGDTNASGGIGIYNGGFGGALGSSTTGATGGGGGAASAILLDDVLIAVAGGGGGGGGAGTASNGSGQVSGQASTQIGGNGANTLDNTGGSAGGGGGGYPLGGIGGTSSGSNAGASSGDNGQNLLPAGWTSTYFGGSIGSSTAVTQPGEFNHSGRAVISWWGFVNTVHWATSVGGTGGSGGYGGFSKTRVTINEGDTVTFGVGGPGTNGISGTSLVIPDFRGGAASSGTTTGGGGGGATVVLVNNVVVAVAGGGGGGGAGATNGALGGHGGSARETGASHTTNGSVSANGLYTGGGGGGGYFGGRSGISLSGGEGGTSYGDYVEQGTQFVPGGKTSTFYKGFPTACPDNPGEVVFVFHRRFNMWKKIEEVVTSGITQTTKSSWGAISNISTKVSSQWKSVVQGWIKKNGNWVPLMSDTALTPTASLISKAPALALTTTTIVVYPPRLQLNIAITQNTLNYNLLGVLAQTPTYNKDGQGTDIILTIHPVVVGSVNVSSVALNVSGLPAKDSLTIINNGTIVGTGGYGGNGGSSTYSFSGWYGYGYNLYSWNWTQSINSKGWYAYGGWSTVHAPTAGGPGGVALKTTGPIRLQNNGIIGGGGGGGGGGVHAGYWQGYMYAWHGDWYHGTGGGGGGGGAGWWGGAAGSGGVGYNSLNSYYWIWWGYYNAYTAGGSGGTGSTLFGGAGGSGSQTGGAGGGLGQAGVSRGAGGGAPGAAIVGHSLITYVAVGDIRGAKIG